MRLSQFKNLKKKTEYDGWGSGMYGGKAENQILEEEQLVDLVVGPDAYRDYPIF
jgi:tRNA-2-methylthio-N6-dimethylallyladenosine synthase